VLFGLTAAVAGGLSIANGAVAQSNYHDFPVLALNDSPAVQVELLSSDAPPAGAGKAGVPLAAPAVANAWFAARSERLRDLPLRWAAAS
jgi:CO/xanthine dehydrogenase Mo-binding subunit